MKLNQVALLLASLQLATIEGSDTSLADKASCNPGVHSVPNPSPEPDPIAPDKFTVTWQTTASSTQPIVVEVVREWSPLGVDRFFQLVLDNFFPCAAFFRVVPNFVVQFGIASQPDETLKWNTFIPDDPVLRSNTYGMVSFATSGPNTRTSQIFINTADNSRLDADGFSPFARVVEGMEVVESLYNLGNCSGSTCLDVDQDNYTEYGNAWVLEKYPDIDLITSQTYEVGGGPTDSPTGSPTPSTSGAATLGINGKLGTLFAAMALV